jgi:hypothetical protein
MTRYYTRSGTFKHGLVADRVAELFFLFWNHKKKEHCFIGVDFIRKYHKDGGSYFGTPVVFESLEHEKEFLAYHPDAACMRRHVRFASVYTCYPTGLTEYEIPVEFRHGRWCWKKR